MAAALNGSAVKRFIRSLEVPPPKRNAYAITQWVNADLIPMDRSRRTWDGWKYVVYWATGGRPSLWTACRHISERVIAHSAAMI